MPVKTSCDWCTVEDGELTKDYTRNTRCITHLCESCLTELIDADLERTAKRNKKIQKLKNAISKLVDKIYMQKFGKPRPHRDPFDWLDKYED